MPAQHNLYLSAIPGENPDIFLCITVLLKFTEQAIPFINQNDKRTFCLAVSFQGSDNCSCNFLLSQLL